jgi:hypothetical protein
VQDLDGSPGAREPIPRGAVADATGETLNQTDPISAGSHLRLVWPQWQVLVPKALVRWRVLSERGSGRTLVCPVQDASWWQRAAGSVEVVW